jgi:hypothetical protein
VVRIRFNGNREAKVQSHQTFHIFFDKTTAGGGVAVIRTLKNIRKLILEVIFRDLEKLLV